MEKSSTISLSEAKTQGLKTYFTGIPCTRNHISIRRVSDRACLDCKKLIRGKSDAKYRKRNRESIRVTMQTYREKNRELVNKSASMSRQKAYAKNPERMKALRRAQVALRKARKLQATPKWVNLEELKKVYVNCPEGYHVDHIVPLVNPLVCGLHVIANLQYLTKKENLQKGNRFSTH